VWQALRTELAPKGVEVVTVALDTGGADAAGPFIAAAAPDHPSLIDEAHVSAERFGFVNVPNAVWIDEDGMIVRPSHPAHVKVSKLREIEVTPDMGYLGEMLTELQKFQVDAATYLEAMRDWVEHGADSRWALSPEQVVEASRPRPREHAEAAAAFELGQHLHRAGHRDDAVAWFKRAHELHPENWTYKRQAWTFVTTPEGQPSDLIQADNDVYGTSWLDEVRRLGPETYYEPFG
jgi:tetratricopeptide (TPR) repeat protein